LKNPEAGIHHRGAITRGHGQVMPIDVKIFGHAVTVATIEAAEKKDLKSDGSREAAISAGMS